MKNTILNKGCQGMGTGQFGTHYSELVLFLLHFIIGCVNLVFEESQKESRWKVSVTNLIEKKLEGHLNIQYP